MNSNVKILLLLQYLIKIELSARLDSQQSILCWSFMSKRAKNN